MAGKPPQVKQRHLCPLCYVQSIERQKVGCGYEMFLQRGQEMCIRLCRKVGNGMKEVCHGDKIGAFCRRSLTTAPTAATTTLIAAAHDGIISPKWIKSKQPAIASLFFKSTAICMKQIRTVEKVPSSSISPAWHPQGFTLGPQSKRLLKPIQAAVSARTLRSW